jgi:hypothetical protein
MHLHSLLAKLGLTFALAGAAWAAQAQPNVSVSVDGVIRPGVYGRVVIGSQPPPPVIYPQPVIITQPVIVTQPNVVVQRPVVVQQQPIYMHVPPGHAKNWQKHCYKYNACNQPVYFVQNNYSEYYEREDHGHGRGHGRGKHKGRDRDED